MNNGFTRTCTLQIYKNNIPMFGITSNQVENRNYSSGCLSSIINTNIINGDTFDMRLQDIESAGFNSNIRLFSGQLSLLGYHL